MAAVAADYEGRVEVVGVAGRGAVPEMRAFVDDLGVDGFPHVVDQDGSIWSGFGVAGQPAFALIDDDGTIEVVLGPLGEDGLRRAADELLAG